MKVARVVGFAVGLALLVGCGSEQEGLLEGTNQDGTFLGDVNQGGGFGPGGSTPPTINIEAPAAPVNEGSTLTVTVRMSNRYSEDVSIPFSTTFENIGATAAATPETAGAADVVAVTASPLVIPAGQTSGTIVFTVVDDPFQEEPPVETFTLALGSPSIGEVGPVGSATLSINDSDDDTLDSSISGRVTNGATGTGIAAVTVTGGGISAQSDALGFYKLNAPTPAQSIVVTFTKAGFVSQNRTTEAVKSSRSAAVINVPMLAVATTDTFDPTAAHTTTSGTVAQVAFGAATLETAAGAAPTGNVTASVTPIAPSTDVNQLPGMYLAGDGIITPVSLESFGALAISVVDTGGNVLRLKSGQSAAIRIPASTRGTALPANLTLYSFDSALGLWRQQGAATLAGVAPDQYYQGSIAALGTWGANVNYATEPVTGCVVDPTGSRVGEATVIAEGTNYIGTSTVVTDAEGKFALSMRNGSSAFVQANFRSGLSNARTTTGGALSPCLLVIAGAASIRLTWGAAPSDLDSHTLGPNSNDHVYWVGRGSLTTHPFIGLDVDDTTGFGPEVTTIVKAAKSRKYRFMVRNYSQSYTPGQTGSPAKVELFVKGKQYVFTPPAGETSSTATWHVFDLTTDAACEITTITPITVVPWLDLTDAGIDDPARNPNTDNAATFCN